VFAVALGIPDPRERAAYLDRVCAASPELRKHVESLLAAYEAGQFLEAPAHVTIATVAESASACPGIVIGNYTLLEQIGEGGFGVVFMAEQQQPIRRKVALKVLKPGMDSKQVIARFEAERQALALMDHPHIAKVLDAGQTTSGRPFFVMDLVKGLPITEFCDQSRLTLQERLELFVHICQAVQHAHQKGIIHRDIKPSNVLVTLHDGTPLVKVIDFGVAKAIGQQLTDKTLFTGFAQMIGTPLYMSPEQAALSAVDVDTRSDIYSLGVLLYELLTGTTPFTRERFEGKSYDEMRRIIREEDPPRPSARIATLGQAATTVSAQRKSDPKQLKQLFRGELDWVVMKCLEKDRNRRYETANGLAQDIERYLRDEAVLACPPSTLYRLRKFARRNKAGLVTAGLLLTALVTTVAVLAASASWSWEQYERATAAQQQAQTERDLSDDNLRLADQVLENIYLHLAEKELPRDPQREEEHLALLRETLGFYTQFAARNAANPRVRYRAGKAYLRAGVILGLLSRPTEADQALTRGIDLLQQVPADSPQWLEARQLLGNAHNERGKLFLEEFRFAEAEQACRQARAIHEELLAQSGRGAVARADLAADCGNLAGVLREVGKLEESDKLLEKSQELAGQLVQESPKSASFRSNLAAVLAERAVRQREQGSLEGALKLHNQAIDHQQVAIELEPKNPVYRAKLCGHYSDLAATLTAMRRHDAALRACEQEHSLIGPLVREYPRVPVYLYQQIMGHCRKAEALRDMYRDGEERAVYEEMLPLLDKLSKEYGDRPRYRQDVAILHRERAHALETTGRTRDAKAAYRQALDLRQQLPQARLNTAGYRQETAALYLDLGNLLMQTDQFGESEKALGKAATLHEELHQEFPTEPSYRFRRARSHSWLGIMFMLSSQLEKAEEPLRVALVLQRQLVKDQANVALYRYDLANTLNAWGTFLRKNRRFDEAERAMKEALDLREQLAEESPNSHRALRDLAVCHHNLGLHYADTKEPDQADQAYKKARALYEKLVVQSPVTPEYHNELAGTANNQGMLRLEGGDLAGARALFEEAIRHVRVAVKLDPNVPRYRNHLVKSSNNLADVQIKQGDHAALAKTATAFADIDWSASAQGADYAITAAGLASRDAKLPQAERAVLARTYADQARRLVRKAVEQCPDRFDDRIVLGQKLYSAAHRLDEGGWKPHALEALQPSIAIAENNVEKLDATVGRQWLAGAYLLLGWLLREAGQTQEAEEAYRKALPLWEKLVQDFPKNAAHKSSLASTLNNLALRLHDRGAAAEARQLLEQAIKHRKAALDLDPDNATYHRDLAVSYGNLAETLLKLGDHMAAAKAAQEQPRAYPDWRTYRSAAFLLGRCLRLVDKDAQLSEAERRAQALSYAAQARDLLREAGERSAKDPSALNALAGFLVSFEEARLHDYALAIKLAKQATQLAPTKAPYWNTLGVAHYRAGEWQAAVTALEESVKLGKGGVAIDHFFLALACSQLAAKEPAQKEKALDWYRRGVQWMTRNEKNLNQKDKESLQHLRDEAAALLHLKEESLEQKPQ
jgi:serine/threonine protein kinase/Flp pilus assembly protein TadD